MSAPFILQSASRRETMSAFVVFFPQTDPWSLIVAINENDAALFQGVANDG
jgi:hypothetical protein